MFRLNNYVNKLFLVAATVSAYIYVTVIPVVEYIADPLFYIGNLT